VSSVSEGIFSGENRHLHARSRIVLERGAPATHRSRVSGPVFEHVLNAPPDPELGSPFLPSICSFRNAELQEVSQARF
jgi:hypothetical protein